VSGSLTRPDYRADIRDLGRRLGILERRTTPKPTIPPQESWFTIHAPYLLVSNDSRYTETVIPLDFPVDMTAGVSTGGEAHIGPALITPGGWAVQVHAGYVRIPFIPHPGNAGLRWEMILHVANADCSEELVAQTGYNSTDPHTLILPGPSTIEVPVPSGWYQNSIGSDLSLFDPDDGGRKVVVSEAGGVFWASLYFQARSWVVEGG
jgi:hypothetical protein